MNEPAADPPVQRALLLTFDYPPIVGGIANVLGRLWRLAGHEGCTILAPAFEGDREFDAEHPVTTRSFLTPQVGATGKLIAFAAAALRTAW